MVLLVNKLIVQLSIVILPINEEFTKFVVIMHIHFVVPRVEDL